MGLAFLPFAERVNCAGHDTCSRRRSCQFCFDPCGLAGASGHLFTSPRSFVPHTQKADSIIYAAASHNITVSLPERLRRRRATRCGGVRLDNALHTVNVVFFSVVGLVAVEARGVSGRITCASTMVVSAACRPSVAGQSRCQCALIPSDRSVASGWKCSKCQSTVGARSTWL